MMKPNQLHQLVSGVAEDAELFKSTTPLNTTTTNVLSATILSSKTTLIEDLDTKTIHICAIATFPGGESMT
ncbi:unnamed protein product [Ambrosiozyma monospora]|uniref:Unnamed protein product n=1 Tax=Ambrosiozyma monospora TaxID=43982 RepID=A0ACB5UB96_AMBMO|nr:unnamed protein product [Ambrosiozyma monospora]